MRTQRGRAQLPFGGGRGRGNSGNKQWRDGNRSNHYDHDTINYVSNDSAEVAKCSMGSAAPEGGCLWMCPESEQNMRIRERLIHPLESEQFWEGGSAEGTKRHRTASRSLMVKTYRRCAAGLDELMDSASLRPCSVLQQTVQYLMRIYNSRPHPDPYNSIVYEFVSDRLRAVRQDMTIQQLSANDQYSLCHLMLPFYFIASHRCVMQPCCSYEPRLHEFQVHECITRWQSALFTVEPKSITQQINQLSIHNNTSQSSSIDSLAVYLLFAAEQRDSMISINSYGQEHSILADCECHTTIKWTKRLINQYHHGNFYRFFRLLRLSIDMKLCLMVRAAAWRLIAKMRVHALTVLSVAYGSKTLTVPVIVIGNWLGMDNDMDTVELMSLFGADIINNSNVRFGKVNETLDLTAISKLVIVQKCNWLMARSD